MNETKAARAQRVVDAWNARHPVGTPIRWWPGVRGDGPGLTGRTAHPATVLGGHTPVAWPDQPGGCVALDHVQALTSTGGPEVGR